MCNLASATGGGCSPLLMALREDPYTGKHEPLMVMGYNSTAGNLAGFA